MNDDRMRKLIPLPVDVRDQLGAALREALAELVLEPVGIFPTDEIDAARTGADLIGILVGAAARARRDGHVLTLLAVEDGATSWTGPVFLEARRRPEDEETHA